MYKTRRAVSKVFVFNPKTIKIWKQSKSSNSERERELGWVCVCFPFSIIIVVIIIISLSLFPSNMGSSNSRLDSRPSRPSRVNGTNRSNLFSLICGGSSSRATHQVHHFQPKKSFLSFTYFYQYPFRFLCLFSINSWILIFKIWLFGVLGFAQSVPKIVPIHHHHRGNLFFLSCKSNT